jgi:hypothetical protein
MVLPAIFMDVGELCPRLDKIDTKDKRLIARGYGQLTVPAGVITPNKPRETIKRSIIHQSFNSDHSRARKKIIRSFKRNKDNMKNEGLTDDASVKQSYKRTTSCNQQCEMKV